MLEDECLVQQLGASVDFSWQFRTETDEESADADEE